jgi:hypothetical protein
MPQFRGTKVTSAACHSSSIGAVRVCLTRARCALVRRRRRFEAAVGLVAMRGTGGSAARWINRISISSAACRFRSCVRKRCAVNSTSPRSVTRLPANARSRSCTACGSPDTAGSNRSCTAVATLLTFCPPGPEARTKFSSIAFSSIARDGVIRIIRSRTSRGDFQARLRRPARFAGRPDLRPSPIFLASADRVCA